MAQGKYCEESLSLSFFLIQVLLVVALSFSLQCTFMNGLPTICLIRVVNDTPSSLTKNEQRMARNSFLFVF